MYNHHISWQMFNVFLRQCLGVRECIMRSAVGKCPPTLPNNVSTYLLKESSSVCTFTLSCQSSLFIRSISTINTAMFHHVSIGGESISCISNPMLLKQASVLAERTEACRFTPHVVNECRPTKTQTAARRVFSNGHKQVRYLMLRNDVATSQAAVCGMHIESSPLQRVPT